MNKKIKTLLFSLGTSTVIIAPVATLVACGNSSPIKSISSQHSLFDNHTIYQIPKYTPDSLKSDALKYKDNSVWLRGVAQESLQQSLSFVKAFAETIGYDRQRDFINKDTFKFDVPEDLINSTKTSKEVIEEVINRDFANTGRYRLHQDSTDANVKKLFEDKKLEMENEITIFREFKARKMRDADKINADLASGKDSVDGDHPFKMGLDWNATVSQESSKPGMLWHDQNHMTDNVKYSDDIKWNGFWVNAQGVHAQLTKIASWSDKASAGTSIINIMSKNNLFRNVSNPDGIQKYSILDETTLKNDFLPVFKDMIYTFARLYTLQKRDADFGFSYINPDLKYIFKFLIDKFTHDDGTNKEFILDETTLWEALKKLNNGSHHLLAIKSLYAGFDKSFTENDHRKISVEGGFAGKWEEHKDLDGLVDMDKINKILGITNFIYEAQELPFVATQTWDEITKNNVKYFIESRNQKVTDLVKAKETNWADLEINKAQELVRKAEVILGFPQIFKDVDASWVKTQQDLDNDVKAHFTP